LIDRAAEAGTDAIKFQMFRAERVVTRSAEKAAYQLKSTGSDESQLEMLRRLELDEQAHRQLWNRCVEKGILFLSTAFDFDSVDFLFELGVAAFKIPSGEITNTPYIRHVASKGRPLIMSTGMSLLGEVETALQATRDAGNEETVLLHSTTSYPAAAENVNLRAMSTMSSAFGVPVGYSDHSTGIEIPVAAVALGACVIEKHFTTDRTLPGPDHRSSLEPAELASMVAAIRKVEKALGDGVKIPSEEELHTAAIVRRSIVTSRRLESGTVLAEDMITLKRPGSGMSPAMLPQVIGRKLRRNVEEDTLLTLDMIE
jgi:N,N'-diacetyllegionaminate synthase